MRSLQGSMPVILLSLSQLSLKLRLTPRRRGDSFFIAGLGLADRLRQSGEQVADGLRPASSGRVAGAGCACSLIWSPGPANLPAHRELASGVGQGCTRGGDQLPGGVHCGQDSDAVTPPLRSVLGLMGISEVFIYTEGLDIQPHGRDAGIACAREQLIRLTKRLTATAFLRWRRGVFYFLDLSKFRRKINEYHQNSCSPAPETRRPVEEP